MLVPAAIENQITGKNAGSIKARIVAEAANGPHHSEGNDILINNMRLHSSGYFGQRWLRNRVLF